MGYHMAKLYICICEAVAPSIFVTCTLGRNEYAKLHVVLLYSVKYSMLPEAQTIFFCCTTNCV